MNVPTKSDLIHYKIQAAMRENIFDEDQMKYLGVREDEVSADQFEQFEMNHDD